MLTEGRSADLFEQFVQWANCEPSIKAVVLFGSQVRVASAVNTADQWSDFDIQVVTTRPQMLLQEEWLGSSFEGRELLVRSVRPASAGVQKITLIFSPSVEFDIVIVPAFRMRLARYAIKFSLQNRVVGFASALDELAYVMRPGHRVIKGGVKWANFYSRVVTEMTGTRLNDAQIIALAQLFICELLWVRRMIARGELIAAQRTLHRSLAEINFQFLHELRRRKQEITFREARRLEFVATPEQLAAVSIASCLEPIALRTVVAKAADTCREFVAALIGERWKWPLEVDTSLNL